MSDNIEPISLDWAWLDEIGGPFDDDFVAATEEHIAPQLRPDLDAVDAIE